MGLYPKPLELGVVNSTSGQADLWAALPENGVLVDLGGTEIGDDSPNGGSRGVSVGHSILKVMLPPLSAARTR